MGDAFPHGIPFAQIPSASKRLRVLLFAKRKRHTRVTRHLLRGFGQNGHTAGWLHSTNFKHFVGRTLAARMMDACTRMFRPDIVIVYGKDVPLDVLQSLPSSVPSGLFYHDFWEEPDQGVVEVGQHSTVVFTPLRGYVTTLKGFGLENVMYVKDGCDRTEHYPVKPVQEFAAPVSFIGSLQEGDCHRRDLMRAVAQSHSLHLYGRGWLSNAGLEPVRRHVYPDEYRKVCASSAIMLGNDHGLGVDLGFSNRTWMTLGCGGFLLTSYVPNLEEIFTNHEHLVWYRSPEECLELIEYYLPRRADRRRIARTGCGYVRNYYTYRHTAARMVRELMKAQVCGTS